MKKDTKKLSFGRKVIMIFLLAEKNKEIRRQLIAASLVITALILFAILKQKAFFSFWGLPFLLISVAFLAYLSYKLRWEFHLERLTGFQNLRQEIEEDDGPLKLMGLLIPQNDLSLIIMTSRNSGLKTPKAYIKDRSGKDLGLRTTAKLGADKKHYLHLDLSEVIELLGPKAEIRIGAEQYQWTNPWHLDLNKVKMLAFKVHDFKILLSEGDEKFPDSLALKGKRGIKLVLKESNLLPYLEYQFDFYTGKSLYKKNLLGRYSYEDESLNFELPDNLEKEDLVGENIRLIYNFDPRFKIESEIILSEEMNQTKYGPLRLYRPVEI